jgi:hypothetical protein
MTRRGAEGADARSNDDPPRSTRTPALSVATRRILDRHIERAYRQRFGAATNLRQAVRQATTELTEAGASPAAVHALLMHAVHAHPQRHAWDRVSILTRLRTSDVLTRQVLGWAEHPPAPVATRSPVPSDVHGGPRALVELIR